MKKLPLHFLKTERMQVVFILLFVLFSLFLTIHFVVLPQRELSENNRMVREQLQGSRYDVGLTYGLLSAQLALSLSGRDRDEVLSLLVELLAARTRC